MSAPETKERYLRGLGRTSLQEWKRKTVEVGLGRIASGIEGARDKVRSFAAEFLPHAYRVRDEVKKMPGLTLEDGINRAVHTIRRMAEFRRS